MTTRLLYLFTRTPLHVGAGASVGAIDQPIQRERHTGFPIIPASSLKGSFADQWNDMLEDQSGKRVRGTSTAAWLFGSDDANNAAAGSLLFSEARLLAFPIRSARGSYAWITSQLLLQRAKRDGVFTDAAAEEIKNLKEPEDKQDKAYAIFQQDPLGLGGDKKQIVLEEYCFHRNEQEFPSKLAKALAVLVPDELFKSITERLVLVSNGMMSHFVTTACEVAQHVRISDETGTAEGTGLFNQENVPADTLFYSVLSATAGRSASFKDKKPEDSLNEFANKLTAANHVFQFGGDASTGLGFCSVQLADGAQSSQVSQP